MQKIEDKLQQKYTDNYFNQAVLGCTSQWVYPGWPKLSTKIPLTIQGQGKDL